jgi:hypothetical protein
MAPPADAFLVDFPTLFVAVDWAEAHCVVPDGFKRGRAWRYYPWQAWCTLNHYRVKPTAYWRPENPLLATAFHNRRSLVIAPQKTGKGPWSATGVAIEAVGPALFAGWAGRGDGWSCADHGCGCGWEYEYQPGEPMAMRWPTPLIQITAFSEDNTDNVYRPLQSMIKLGPLGDLMRVGESFVRIGDEGRIDVVTSSAQSRLGNPVTYAPQDEVGIWTKANKMQSVAETQRRGLAGMGGRCQETTNAFDPTQKSVGQASWLTTVEDVFKFYRPPPAHLSYKDKRERRRIHQIVYEGSAHVDIDGIEAEAAELIEKGEAAQAERFFGNRMKAGSGVWCDIAKWKDRAKPREVPRGTPIVLGMDGSDTNDWTGIRAQTADGYQFTPRYGAQSLPTIWNPAEYGGQVPRLDVRDAVRWLMTSYNVVRMYVDPPMWTTEVDDWAAEYGDKVVLRWYTQRLIQMHHAAERLLTDISKQGTGFSHDGCLITYDHVEATHKEPRGTGDPPRYVLCKPEDGRKIDLCVSSVLANEAAGDVTAADLWEPPDDGLTTVVGTVTGY